MWSAEEPGVSIPFDQRTLTDPAAPDRAFHQPFLKSRARPAF